MKKTGKIALSFENAIKNIPPEVVKLKSKNSPGAGGHMVHTGEMCGTNNGCDYHAPKTYRR